MATGALVYYQTCAVATSPCPLAYQVNVSGYLIDPVNQSVMDFLLSQSGIDWEVVYTAFGYSLFIFAVGLSVGLLVNVVKKLRI